MVLNVLKEQIAYIITEAILQQLTIGKQRQITNYYFYTYIFNVLFPFFATKVFCSLFLRGIFSDSLQIISKMN